MKKEQYVAQRKTLMEEAENMITEGKIEESQAKMREVQDLDNKWENIKLANANLNALKDNDKVTELENKSVDVKGGKTLENIHEAKPVSEQKVYENAWAKHMMGQKLTGDESEVFNKVNAEFNNAYTHDTGNTGVLIPTTVAAGIWSRAEEMYPLFADVKKFGVKGRFVIKKHVSIDAGDADWYTEGTPTADEQNTFGELVLDGHELSKAVTVSWKLRAMAIEDFIPYIINELGERVGVALGVSVARGTGTNQPRGVETALIAQAGTPQVVTYDPDNATTPVDLSYGLITEAIGKIHSSYLSGSAIYANNGTIWGQLANLMDAMGRPLFIPDVTSGGVGRMFGMVVKPDAGLSAGSILIGDANKGYVFNTNEPFSVVTEDHAKQRVTDYVAYAVVDGDVMDEKAFALIRNVPTP
ncbi:phage major capsid protein [Paenibacillus sp. Dod16]|uniref:phage major capsid protein n=1 Tax=Paenibacillus sp. Dod16 TaxID=3416392 RepID=UPI003CF932F1